MFSALRPIQIGRTMFASRGLTTNATDKPQVVQSIERPMQAFRPSAEARTPTATSEDQRAAKG